MARAVKTRNPMKTKNDRVRLGPLSVAQLEDILQKPGKPKIKGKVQRRLLALKKRS